jgi:hypothetical protein
LRERMRRALAGLVASVSFVSGMSGVAMAAAGAAAAHTLNVTDEAHLRYHESSSSALIEEGTATGGLPGAMKVHFTVGHDDGGYLISTVYTKLADRRARDRAQRAMDAYRERQQAKVSHLRLVEEE